MKPWLDKISRTAYFGLFAALHLAAQMGHLSTVRILLSQSDIKADAINMRFVCLSNMRC